MSDINPSYIHKSQAFLNTVKALSIIVITLYTVFFAKDTANELVSHYFTTYNQNNISNQNNFTIKIGKIVEASNRVDDAKTLEESAIWTRELLMHVKEQSREPSKELAEVPNPFVLGKDALGKAFLTKAPKKRAKVTLGLFEELAVKHGKYLEANRAKAIAKCMGVPGNRENCLKNSSLGFKAEK